MTLSSPSVSELNQVLKTTKMKIPTKITQHMLEIRKDPANILPISTDLIPADILSKTLFKLDNDFKWDNVAQIPLYKTHDDNFLTELHKVEGAAIEVLYED